MTALALIILFVCLFVVLCFFCVSSKCFAAIIKPVQRCFKGPDRAAVHPGGCAPQMNVAHLQENNREHNLAQIQENHAPRNNNCFIHPPPRQSPLENAELYNGGVAAAPQPVVLDVNSLIWQCC